MPEVKVTLQMHLHDNACGHVDDKGQPMPVEKLDMVTDWFQWSGPSIHLGASGDPLTIVRECKLLSRSYYVTPDKPRRTDG